MGHGKHQQEEAPEPNVGVLAPEVPVLHFSGHGVDDLSFGQELTGLGWRLTVGDVLALHKLVEDRPERGVSGLIDLCSSRRVDGLTTGYSMAEPSPALLDATVLAAADMVRPTPAQIVAAFEVAHIWEADDSGYVLNRMHPRGEDTGADRRAAE
jgi:hypothetical protein